MYGKNSNVLEEANHARDTRAVKPGTPLLRDSSQKPAVSANLSAGMLEYNRMKRPKGTLDFLVSVTMHTVVLLALILIPLYFTKAIDLSQLESTYLVLPPPPPPPAPAVVHAIRRPKILLNDEKLYQPRVIPKQIVQVKDLSSAPQMTPGTVGGVPGGVPGGQLGGVLGGILGGTGQVVPPPPPPKPPAHRGPYRVGGNVQPPQLIHQVQPQYPPLARQTRVQGAVVIDCVIDKQGNITEMRIVSGHPLLVQAAFDAVRLWKYKPTLLNGEPVSVEMQVTVNFSLGE